MTKENCIPADRTTWHRHVKGRKWKRENKRRTRVPRHRRSNASSALTTRFTLVTLRRLSIDSAREGSWARRIPEPETAQCMPRIQFSPLHIKMHTHEEITFKKPIFFRKYFLMLHPATDVQYAAGPCNNILPCYSHTCHNAQFPCCFCSFLIIPWFFK